MVRALAVIALLTYPFVVFFGLAQVGPLPLGFALAGLLLLRLAAFGRLRPDRKSLAAILLIVLFLLSLGLTGDERILKAYPVAIHLGLFTLFAASLAQPPTIIERGLELAGNPAPAHAANYLWWATFAWCGFFLLNAALSAWTACCAPLDLWTLYNGFLSYVLVAVFFGLEYCVRCVYRRRHAQAGQDHE